MPDTIARRRHRPVQLRDRARQDARRVLLSEGRDVRLHQGSVHVRDQYEDFVAAGADVIGVSVDDADSHARFKANHRLPFTLLTDPRRQVARTWGVKRLGPAIGRVTFVFQGGPLRHALRFSDAIWQARRRSARDRQRHEARRDRPGFASCYRLTERRTPTTCPMAPRRSAVRRPMASPHARARRVHRDLMRGRRMLTPTLRSTAARCRVLRGRARRLRDA